MSVIKYYNKMCKNVIKWVWSNITIRVCKNVIKWVWSNITIRCVKM